MTFLIYFLNVTLKVNITYPSFSHTVLNLLLGVNLSFFQFNLI